jgi:hypothetical protein
MINKSFVIYGERNSGTNFLETLITGQSYHLSHNIAAFNIPVINSSIQEYFRSDYGHKHFFGFHDEEIKTASNVIFIGIIRNPYDWIMALNKSLHHIPPVNHKIKDFLLNEWYSIQHNKQSTDYQKEFFRDRDFCTGLRYKNIFAMRSKKLRYLYHTMPTLAKNYELIRYEDLCKDPWSIISRWSKKYYLPLNMPILQPIKKEPYQIESEIQKIIDDNIDWEIENEIGYFKK